MRGTSRSPNSARISIASARSACSSALTERGRTSASASSAIGPTTGHCGRTAREPRVRADQHVVEHAQVAEHAAVLERAREAERRELLGRKAGDVATRRRSRVPASGASSPVTRLNTVVLPAPFGPMMLTSSPSLTASDSALTAVTPPKRRVSPVDLQERRHHTVPIRPCGRIADQQQQRDAVDQHAVLGGGAEQLRQADQHDRAEDRARYVAEPAEDHHGEREQRDLRREGLVVHIGEDVRHQGARDAGGESRRRRRRGSCSGRARCRSCAPRRRRRGSRARCGRDARRAGAIAAAPARSARKARSRRSTCR